MTAAGEPAEIGRVVIAGAGQAGYQTAAALRQRGFAGRVVLVGEEDGVPYQRPPLSKGYLTGRVERDALALKQGAFYTDNDVQLITGRRALGIDRARRQLTLSSGAGIDYDHLVLALGARHRELRVPGADLAGVFALRTVTEAEHLRAALREAEKVVVVGAGFIGLEFAVAACGAGIDVTVLEKQPRVMPRVVSEPTAEFFASRHASQGVRLLLNTGVRSILGEGGKVAGVELDDGAMIEADLVVTGVGVQPNIELAADAGLATDNGIVVDESLRTHDPAISAIGDCASFPSRFNAGGAVRLESVQNAMDQARCVAERLTGSVAPYGAVPWFWSDQGAVKLQIAGLTGGHDSTVVRGDPATGAFSVFCFHKSRLLGAESVGRAGEHLATRRILAAGASLAPEQAADVEFDLKSYSKAC